MLEEKKNMSEKKIESESILLEEISKYKEVMLYGCGEVGKFMQQSLYQKDIEVECFIVTEEPETREVNGLPVYTIQEISSKCKNILVMIATKENLHQEILQKTEYYKIPNVIYITDELYLQLRKRVKIPRRKLYFQVHITEHCNLNCRGCYHFSPLAEQELLSIEEYTKDIKRLSELFYGEMEQILLLGGEPLLHPQIAEFISVTRSYFSAGTIKILSNGILLPKMEKAFWNACVDSRAELWLTKYPISINYNEIEQIAERHGVKIHYFNVEPVRTLGHQPLDISGKRNYKDNFENCYRANECILLDHGRMYTCLVAAESKHFSKYYGIDLKVSEQDYVDIYAVNSGQELQKKLVSPTPFCRYCNRDDVAIFGRIPWQVSKRCMEEWTE